MTTPKQEGRNGPVSRHWLICEIGSYQALKTGISFKQKTPKKELKLVAMVLMFSNTKISKNFRI